MANHNHRFRVRGGRIRIVVQIENELDGVVHVLGLVQQCTPMKRSKVLLKISREKIDLRVGGESALGDGLSCKRSYRARLLVAAGVAWNKYHRDASWFKLSRVDALVVVVTI